MELRELICSTCRLLLLPACISPRFLSPDVCCSFAMSMQAESNINDGEVYTQANCCSMKPIYSDAGKPMAGKPCDMEHYCNYSKWHVCRLLWLCLASGRVIQKNRGQRPDCVCTLPCAVDSKEYEGTQTGGIIAFICMLVVALGTVIARDILQIWTCFGLTEAGYTAPTRQLTTMSSAFAPAVCFKFVSISLNTDPHYFVVL